MRNLILTITLAFLGLGAFAQSGIGTPTPNPSAQLHIEASNKGILIPRVALTSLTDNTTIAEGNVNSLLVFNTNVDANENLSPGYYYWFDTEWKRLMPKGDIYANVKYDGKDFYYTDASGTEIKINLEELIQGSETNTFIRKVKTDGTVTSPIVYYYFSEKTIKDWLEADAANTIADIPNNAPGVVAIEPVGDVVENFEYILKQKTIYKGGDITIEEVIKNISSEVEGNVIYVNDKDPNDPNAVDNWVFKYFNGTEYVTINLGDFVVNNQRTYEVKGGNDVNVTNVTDENHTTYTVEVKAAMPKFFYMPTILFDTSTIRSGIEKDLHAEYISQFTNVVAKNTSAPAVIPHIPEAEDLHYYITDYDATVISNISITDDGKMTYDVISNAGPYSYITVIFVVK